ncbi:MAG TPA: hypothetical protein VNO32_43295 [Candidatus Acidoferrum sp.]|nr:hypothetical protein [Candidatus Acidoferrum sp.]
MKAILVQFTDPQAAALEAHKQQTLVPTAAFIRLAVERALGQPIIEAEPELVQQMTCRPVKLLVAEIQKKAEVEPCIT